MCTLARVRGAVGSRHIHKSWHVPAAWCARIHCPHESRSAARSTKPAHPASTAQHCFAQIPYPYALPVRPWGYWTPVKTCFPCAKARRPCRPPSPQQRERTWSRVRRAAPQAHAHFACCLVHLGVYCCRPHWLGASYWWLRQREPCLVVAGGHGQSQRHPPRLQPRRLARLGDGTGEQGARQRRVRSHAQTGSTAPFPGEQQARVKGERGSTNCSVKRAQRRALAQRAVRCAGKSTCTKQAAVGTVCKCVTQCEA